jgi:hypothetical protein
MKACDQSKESTIDRRSIRVSYAQSRGDKEQITQKNENKDISRLFIGFTSSAEVPTENIILSIFSRFGKVNDVVIKVPAGGRPYAFVEFDA